jgi:hypothetical protein
MAERYFSVLYLKVLSIPRLPYSIDDKITGDWVGRKEFEREVIAT